MNLIDILKLSTRMFKARTTRTLLTILGMGIGISAILFLVSLGYGLQNVLLEKITTSDSLLALDVNPINEGQRVITPEIVQELEKVDNVTEVSPVLQISSQINLNDLTSSISTYIITSSFLKLDGIEVDEGEGLNDEKKNGVIVTSAFTKIFKEETDSILGKKIGIEIKVPENAGDSEDSKANEKFKKVEISELFEIIGVIEKDEPLVYVNIKDVLEYTTVPRFSKAKVKAKNSSSLNNIRDILTEKGFMVSSLSETVDQANKVFRVIQIVLGLFGIIALFVSAIGMFNTMTVTLMERTQEIGIMKSIGVSNQDILLMFVAESSVMGFFGGLAGILLGMLEGETFNWLLNFISGRFGGEPIDLFYSPLWFTGTIVVAATIVGFATGLVPARRASSLDPLDALRYK